MTLLTVSEVAAILRVSPATARGLLRGGLPHVRLGRQYRVRIDDLDRWLAGQVHTAQHGEAAEDARQRRGQCLEVRGRAPQSVGSRPRRRMAGRRPGDQADPLRRVGARGAGTVERYLVPDLGTVPLLTLSPSRVEAMLARHGRLSANTRAGMRGVLRRSLADALKDGVIVRNAAALARPPKQDRVQRTAPTTAEVRALLAALEGHRLRDLVLVMAATGLRVGEATGLTWDGRSSPSAPRPGRLAH